MTSSPRPHLVPVREYTSADEIRAHAAALRARMFAPTRAKIEHEQRLRAEMAAQKAAADAVRVAAEKRVEAEAEARRTAEAEAFRPHGPDPAKLRSGPREIMRRVAAHYDLTVHDLTGPCRTKPVARARQLAQAAVYLQCPALSMPSIGRLFGGRDHTTVLHGLRKFGVGRERTWPAQLYQLRQLVESETPRPTGWNGEGCA